MNVLKAAASALGGFGSANSHDVDNKDITSDTNPDTDTTNASQSTFNIDHIQKQLFDAKLHYNSLAKSSEEGFKNEEERLAFQKNLQEFKDQILAYSQLCEKNMIKQQRHARLERQRIKARQKLSRTNANVNDTDDTDAFVRPPLSTNTSFFDTTNIQSFSEIERENEKAVRMLENVIDIDYPEPFSKAKLSSLEDNSTNTPRKEYSHKVMTPTGKVWRIPLAKNDNEFLEPPSFNSSLDPIPDSGQLKDHVINLSTSSMEVMAPSIQDEISLQVSSATKTPTNNPRAHLTPEFKRKVFAAQSLNKSETPDEMFPKIDLATKPESSNNTGTGISKPSPNSGNKDVESLMLNLDDLDLESGFSAVKTGKLVQRFKLLSEEYRKLNTMFTEQKNEVSILKDSNSHLRDNLALKEEIIRDKDLIIQHNRDSIDNTPPKKNTEESSLHGRPLLEREVQRLKDVHSSLHSEELTTDGHKIPLIIMYLLQHTINGLSLFADGASTEEIAEKLGVGGFFKDTPNYDSFYFNDEETNDYERTNTNETTTPTATNFNANSFTSNDHGTLNNNFDDTVDTQHDNTNNAGINGSSSHPPQSTKHALNTPKPNTVKTKTHPYHISKQVSWKSPRHYQYFRDNGHSPNNNDSDFEDEPNPRNQSYEDVDSNGNYMLDPSTNPNLIPIRNPKLRFQANREESSTERQQDGSFRTYGYYHSITQNDNNHARLQDNAVSKITAEEFSHFSPTQKNLLCQYYLKKKEQKIQDLIFVSMIQQQEIRNYKQVLKRQRQLWETIHVAIFNKPPPLSRIGYGNDGIFHPTSQYHKFLLYSNNEADGYPNDYDTDDYYYLDSNQHGKPRRRNRDELRFRVRLKREKNRKFFCHLILAVLGIVRLRMRARKSKAEKTEIIDQIKSIQ